MPDRAERIASFRSGQTQVLFNVDLLSTGYDDPGISAGIFLRPTGSLALYIQMVGRFLRIAEGKQNAIILDHVGNTARHGLVDEDREWTLDGRPKRKPGEATPATRQCIECYAVHRPAPVCPCCGYTYQTKAREIEERDGELVELTSATVKPRVTKVDLQAMIRAAKTYPDLKDLGERLGYKPTWASFIQKRRNHFRSGRAA